MIKNLNIANMEGVGMSEVEKVIRAKQRIEILRIIHGLKKKEIFDALGFSKQYYHRSFMKSPVLNVKSLMGITKLFDVTEYDLLHATEDEFRKITIVAAYLEYVDITKRYEGLKLGIWKTEIDLKVV